MFIKKALPVLLCVACLISAVGETVKLPHWNFGTCSDLSAWEGQSIPLGWHGASRNDRVNTLERLSFERGILLNGMIISDFFALPCSSSEMKLTLKTGAIGKSAKVYLFLYRDKSETYFRQCAQAFEIDATQGQEERSGLLGLWQSVKGIFSPSEQTFVATLQTSWQSCRYAKVAIDGDEAQLKSLVLEPLKRGTVTLKPNRIPVIYNKTAPTIDGTFRADEWKKSFSWENPFLSLNKRGTYLNGERIYLQSDGENLYLLLRTPSSPVATITHGDGDVYRDNSLELVFSSLDQPDRIYHLAINFAGVVFDEERSVGQLFPNWDCAGLKVAVGKDSYGTNLYLALPFASLKIRPDHGWRFNICRNLPEQSDFSAMNRGGYFKNLMSGYLEKDLVALALSTTEVGGRIRFQAKCLNGSDTCLKITEEGGNSFHSEVDVKEGQAAVCVPASDLPQRYFCLSLRRDQAELFSGEAHLGKIAVNSEQVIKKASHATLLYYPLQQQLAVALSDLTFSQQKNIGRIQCTVGGRSVTMPKMTPFGSGGFTRLPFVVKENGTVYWLVKIYDKQGNLWETAKGEFATKQSFPWLNNGYGKDRIVIPPFTPLTISGTTVSCTLRDYRFGQGGLPTSIIASGKEVLASPIRLIMELPNGEEVPFEGEKIVLTEKAGDRIEFESKVHAGGLSAHLKAWMEYDGVVFYKLQLTAALPVKVKKVYLDIPYADASLFHVASRDFRSGKLFWKTDDLKGSGVIWQSSRLPRSRNVVGNFQPSLWLGSPRNGLSFFAESDQGWINDRRTSCYDLLRVGKDLHLRVNFVSKAATLNETRTIEFGLVANPLKKRTLTGANQGLHWEASFGRTAFNTGLYLRDPYITSLMLDPGRKNSYLMYSAGQEYVEGDPEFKLVQNEFSQDWVKRFNPWEVNLLPRRSGGMTYEDYISRYVVWNRYRVDFMLWRLNQLMKLPIDGVYLDNSFPSFCKNPLTIDQGFLREDGRWQSRFNLLSQRNYLKRAAVLAYLHHKRYPHVVIHNTGTMIPACSAFADTFMDGEMDVTDYYATFSDAWNQVMLAVDWGLVPGRLTMLKSKSLPQSRALLSVFKLHDMFMWYTHPGLDRGLVTQLDNAEREFGISASDTRFFGYWREDSPLNVLGRTSLRASCFVRKGSYLVYIGNPSAKSDVISLAFDCGYQVVDVLTGKKVAFPLKVDSHDFKALRIMKQSR